MKVSKERLGQKEQMNLKGLEAKDLKPERIQLFQSFSEILGSC